MSNGSASPVVSPGLHFLFLNVGHFLDHLFMLIFATVAALVLSTEWGMSYAELIPYATPGFVAFGLFALPAGWLGDRWSRHGMMCVFFVGIGAAAMLAALAQTPTQMALSLFGIGVFAAIYHPVGIALVLEGHEKTGMRVAKNGVWGNMGVAVAALLTGWLIQHQGWRAAFMLPAIGSIVLGVAYWHYIYRPSVINDSQAKKVVSKITSAAAVFDRSLLVRVLSVVFFTTALGGLVFQSTTFALPKVIAERGGDIASSPAIIGWLAFVVFAIGSIGQLIVGYLVDRRSPKPVFIAVALLQVIFFSMMTISHGWVALVIAAGFMLAAFGQIPINDVLVGKVARSEWRGRILAMRYAITISVMALSVPLIAWIHGNWGFTYLFALLAVTATLIMFTVATLPPEKQRPAEASVAT